MSLALSVPLFPSVTWVNFVILISTDFSLDAYLLPTNSTDNFVSYFCRQWTTFRAFTLGWLATDTFSRLVTHSTDKINEVTFKSNFNFFCPKVAK
jgi:hypothetical protein